MDFFSFVLSVRSSLALINFLISRTVVDCRTAMAAAAETKHVLGMDHAEFKIYKALTKGFQRTAVDRDLVRATLFNAD